MAERNWRRAYHEAQDRYRRFWCKWRYTAPTTRITVPTCPPTVYRAGDLELSEIPRLAELVAGYDMERAINKERESEGASRMKQGTAL